MRCNDHDTATGNGTPFKRGYIDYRFSPAFAQDTECHALCRGEDLDGAFALIAKIRPEALVILPASLMTRYASRIAELALNSKTPTISYFRDFPEVGGLMSYGPSLDYSARRAAVYVDRILKGAKPSHLPVQQPTIFELVINLKTAKALGLTVPPTLLARADEVIE